MLVLNTGNEIMTCPMNAQILTHSSTADSEDESVGVQDVEEMEEEHEEAEEREEPEEPEGSESPEEQDEPEEPEERPEDAEKPLEPQQQAPEKEPLQMPVIEPGMAQTRTGPVTVQKASVIVGKAIAKAMARESSVRDAHSRSETPEMQEAPMATPESSDEEEEEMQGRQDHSQNTEI